MQKLEEISPTMRWGEGSTGEYIRVEDYKEKVPLRSLNEWELEFGIHGRGYSYSSYTAIGLYLYGEISSEWPELLDVFRKLTSEEELGEWDREWLKEVAYASGWDFEDVKEDLRLSNIDPSERAERYRELFVKYFNEARESKERNESEQAAEKLWGAVTAFIKLCAALMGVPVVQWSLGKLYRFVEHNIKPEYREHFKELLDSAYLLHRYFYGGDVGKAEFERLWEKTIALLEQARKIIEGT